MYRDLLSKHHPDKGGDEEVTKEIVRQFNVFLSKVMQNAFDQQGDEKTGNSNINDFVDVLQTIKDFNMDVEIIGHWIWCYKGSYHYKEQLKELGFWFSKAKKAWVYSGTKKKKVRGQYRMNQIRAMHGSRKVREYHEEEGRKKISAS